MRVWKFVIPVVVVAAAGVSLVTAAGGSAERPRQDELAPVRAATAKYHDVKAALADGYVETPGCAASPDGGMGIHYVNPANAESQNPTRPGLLLYAPSGQGLRLVGVEYFKADADQDPATDDDRPELFGRSFDGPMHGHFPGQPVHYDLHVWLWEHNPKGMFEMWNPNVSCEPRP